MRAEVAEYEKAELVAQYVTTETGAKFTEGQYAAFAVVTDEGEFAAGVVISNYRPNMSDDGTIIGGDCEISVASANPLAWRPHVCHAIFSYIFEQAGCHRVTSITTKRNKHARGFLEGFGFVLEGRLRLGYDGKRDALIYGLLAKDCRFIGEAGGLNGEEIGASGTAAA